ncbi:MAG: phosphatase PAP2 family protein [Methanobrevibacter wolinii]
MFGIPFLDNSILYFFNKTLYNIYIAKFFEIITYDLGDKFPLFAIIIPFIFLIFDKKYGKKLFSLFFSSYIISFIVSFIIKNTIRRPRPYLTQSFVNKIILENGYSFPSNHSLFAFLIAMLLTYRYEKYAPLWFGLALLMAIARVYEGVHYPSDVFFGGIIGILIGYIVIKYKDKIYHLFRIDI